LTIEELLRDKHKMMKLFWLGLLSSIAFIVLGTIMIMMQWFG